MRIIVAIMVLLMVLAAIEEAQASEVCDPLDSGKIDLTEETPYLWINAPAGELIDGYCVKAGPTVEYVDVSPAAPGVGINHSTWKDISHYSVSYAVQTLPAYSFELYSICTVFEDGSRSVLHGINDDADEELTITAQAPDSGIWNVPANDSGVWVETFRHDAPELGAAWEVIGQWESIPQPMSRLTTTKFEFDCPDPSGTTTTSTPSTTTTLPGQNTTTTTTQTTNTTPKSEVDTPTPPTDDPRPPSGPSSGSSGTPSTPTTGKPTELPMTGTEALRWGTLLGAAFIAGGLAMVGWKRGGR